MHYFWDDPRVHIKVHNYYKLGDNMRTFHNLVNACTYVNNLTEKFREATHSMKLSFIKPAINFQEKKKQEEEWHSMILKNIFRF